MKLYAAVNAHKIVRLFTSREMRDQYMSYMREYEGRFEFEVDASNMETVCQKCNGTGKAPLTA